MIEALCEVPNPKTGLLNRRIGNSCLCSALLKDPVVMNPLATFVLSNVSEHQVTDMHWAGALGYRVFNEIVLFAGKGGLSCIQNTDWSETRYIPGHHSPLLVLSVSST